MLSVLYERYSMNMQSRCGLNNGVYSSNFKPLTPCLLTCPVVSGRGCNGLCADPRIKATCLTVCYCHSVWLSIVSL